MLQYRNQDTIALEQAIGVNDIHFFTGQITWKPYLRLYHGLGHVTQVTGTGAVECEVFQALPPVFSVTADSLLPSSTRSALRA